MTNYKFEFESLYDKIDDLEVQIANLKQELIETDNVLYEILNRLDSMDQNKYTLKNFELGK